MIRLLRRLGRFPAGTATDHFDAAAEAAFLMDGTAEAIPDGVPGPPRKAAKAADGATGGLEYGKMKKDDLLREAMARGLDISPRAKVGEIIAALEASDDS